MTILAFILVGFLLFLLFERITLDRLRGSIPCVISVTGTRGKSSVVRLLASVLRENGRTVLAKTTGSQAQYILPDGSVLDVPRRGVVSILEQKKVLRKAASLGVDCLVVEVMSVQPENHIAESQKILKPDIVLLTNVRRDHTEAMGETEEEIAGVLGLDFVPGSKVYLTEDCRKLMPNSKSFTLHSVPSHDDVMGKPEIAGKKATASNLRLVRSVAREMGITDDVIRRGMQQVVQDIGEFKAWKYRLGAKSFFVVNAFAANDPVSTLELLADARDGLLRDGCPVIGLLNLRADRGDRTLQWIEALRDGAAGQFERLFVAGGHAYAAARKFNNVAAVPDSDPNEVMKSIGSHIPENGALFGFGNIGGLGAKLVGHWRLTGEEHGI